MGAGLAGRHCREGLCSWKRKSFVAKILTPQPPAQFCQMRLRIERMVDFYYRSSLKQLARAFAVENRKPPSPTKVIFPTNCTNYTNFCFCPPVPFSPRLFRSLVLSSPIEPLCENPLCSPVVKIQNLILSVLCGKTHTSFRGKHNPLLFPLFFPDFLQHG